MRSVLTAASAALFAVALAGCVPERAGSPVHPNPIIVREFTFSLGVVTLDPSFGFSLYRGASGVPPSQRAAGVARATAFSLADAITTQLVASGYDAIRADTATPEPGARALIVRGSFRNIDEGRRRQGPHAAETAAVLKLALGLQHAHRIAQRGDGVLEFGFAVGRRDDPARVAAEVDPVDHHAKAQLVHGSGVAIAL